jgi:hypothetical protein
MIRAYQTGQAEVLARLDRINARMQPEMRLGMNRITAKIQNRARIKLSGEVLKVRSGKLRRNVERDIQESGQTITGIVSNPTAYAAAHEYGFHGTVEVREHMRTIKQAFGRPIAQQQITVRAHSMKMNLPEASFMRSALRESNEAGEIRAEMEAAVERAAKQ